MATISSFYGEWIFGQLGNFMVPLKLALNLNIYFLGCNLYGLFGGLFGFSTIGTMALISVERCVVILNPFLTMQMNKRYLICKSHFTNIKIKIV